MLSCEFRTLILSATDSGSRTRRYSLALFSFDFSSTYPGDDFLHNFFRYSGYGYLY